MATKDNTVDAGQSTDAQLPNEPGATLPVPQAAGADAPSDKDIDKSVGKLTKLQQDVIDAEQAVTDANKSPEQLKLEKARAALGDAQSKHYDLVGAADAANAAPMTVAQAKVLAVVDGATSAGDNRAQKFGNDPANPKLADGIDPTTNLVKLSRKTPDMVGDGMAYTEVPKEMVGDYERAGWNRHSF